MHVSFYVIEYLDLAYVDFSIYTFNFLYIKKHIKATCISNIVLKKKL